MYKRCFTGRRIFRLWEQTGQTMIAYLETDLELALTFRKLARDSQAQCRFNGGFVLRNERWRTSAIFFEEAAGVGRRRMIQGDTRDGSD
jgi:hypothetical protein